MTQRKVNAKPDEVVDRVRRIETRLARLATHLGLDRPDDSLCTVDTTGEPPVLVIQALDIPLSSMARVAYRAGMVGCVAIVFRGQKVADLFVLSTPQQS